MTDCLGLLLALRGRLLQDRGGRQGTKHHLAIKTCRNCSGSRTISPWYDAISMQRAIPKLRLNLSPLCNLHVKMMHGSCCNRVTGKGRSAAALFFLSAASVKPAEMGRKRALCVVRDGGSFSSCCCCCRGCGEGLVAGPREKRIWLYVTERYQTAETNISSRLHPHTSCGEHEGCSVLPILCWVLHKRRPVDEKATCFNAQITCWGM